MKRVSALFLTILLLAAIEGTAQRGRYRRLDTSLHDLQGKGVPITIAVGKVATGGSDGTLVYTEGGLDRLDQRFDRTWYLDLASFRRIIGSHHDHNAATLPVKLTLRINRQILRIVHLRSGNRIEARYWCTVTGKKQDTAASPRPVDRTVTIAITADIISKKLDGTTRIEPDSRIRRARYTVYIIPTADFDRFFPDSIVPPGTKITLRLSSQSVRTHTVPAGLITTGNCRGRLTGKR